MGAADYTIRYRCAGDRNAVAPIVVDREDTAYLFSSGALQWRVGGADACERLARLLAGTPTAAADASRGAATHALAGDL